jgi:hypothetical protein
LAKPIGRGIGVGATVGVWVGLGAGTLGVKEAVTDGPACRVGLGRGVADGVEKNEHAARLAVEKRRTMDRTLRER